MGGQGQGQRPASLPACLGLGLGPEPFSLSPHPPLEAVRPSPLLAPLPPLFRTAFPPCRLLLGGGHQPLAPKSRPGEMGGEASAAGLTPPHSITSIMGALQSLSSPSLPAPQSPLPWWRSTVCPCL